MSEQITKLVIGVLPVGVISTLRSAKARLWDWWHRVQTTGDIELKHLRIVGPNEPRGVLYQPTSSKAAKALLSRLELDYPEYTFIDFGSGKGRVVLIASEFPFKAVIGVEFAEELHRIAQRNVRKYRRATVRCSTVRCLLMDAADFVFPTTSLVLFCFNPFDRSLMSVVMKKLQRSLTECPRDAWIICRGQWTATDVIEQLSSIRLLWQDTDAAIYRVGVQVH